MHRPRSERGRVGERGWNLYRPPRASSWPGHAAMGSIDRIPRPRIRTERFLRVSLAGGVGILALLAVVFIGVPYYSSTPPPRCPSGGVAEPPLSCVLAVGPGGGTCASGNATDAWNCSYTFDLEISTAPGLAAPALQNLLFQIVEASGAISNLAFRVTVVESAGCGLGGYNSTINAWGPATAPSQCGPSFANATQIHSGDSLRLVTIPPGGLPFSNVGDHLLRIGVGQFGGSIGASFE
jgi:hypothetical protein